MHRTMVLIVSGVLLIAVFVSCERVTQEPQPPTLKTASISDLSAVPSDYGSLVAVTTTGKFTDWVQLWFEDSAGTIRTVSLNLYENRLSGTSRVIPRN